jgi:hypothetical protein
MASFSSGADTTARRAWHVCVPLWPSGCPTLLFLGTLHPDFTPDN